MITDSVREVLMTHFRDLDRADGRRDDLVQKSTVDQIRATGMVGTISFQGDKYWDLRYFLDGFFEEEEFQELDAMDGRPGENRFSRDQILELLKESRQEQYDEANPPRLRSIQGLASSLDGSMAELLDLVDGREHGWFDNEDLQRSIEMFLAGDVSLDFKDSYSVGAALAALAQPNTYTIIDAGDSLDGRISQEDLATFQWHGG
jgi:hypothetical protein